MNTEDVKKLLEEIKEDKISIEDGVNKFKELNYHDLGYAKIDTHREIRVGYPEVIYCEGKTVEQVRGIIEFMLTKDNNILGTRATYEMYEAVTEICSNAVYNPMARTITIQKRS